jgi:transcriptional regulator with XRE-family HTH domain
MGLFDRFRRSGGESNVVKLSSGGDKGTLNIVAFYDAKSRSPYFFFVYYDDEAVLRTIKEKLLSGDWVLIMGDKGCLDQVIHNVYEFSKFGKDFIYMQFHAVRLCLGNKVDKLRKLLGLSKEEFKHVIMTVAETENGGCKVTTFNLTGEREKAVDEIVKRIKSINDLYNRWLNMVSNPWKGIANRIDAGSLGAKLAPLYKDIELKTVLSFIRALLTAGYVLIAGDDTCIARLLMYTYLQSPADYSKLKPVILPIKHKLFLIKKDRDLYEGLTRFGVKVAEDDYRETLVIELHDIGGECFLISPVTADVEKILRDVENLLLNRIERKVCTVFMSQEELEGMCRTLEDMPTQNIKFKLFCYACLHRGSQQTILEGLEIGRAH